jgi:hypothetical protein
MNRMTGCGRGRRQLRDIGGQDESYQDDHQQHPDSLPQVRRNGLALLPADVRGLYPCGGSRYGTAGWPSPARLGSAPPGTVHSSSPPTIEGTTYESAFRAVSRHAVTRFTPKQGQYLAFIHAYTLVLGRPPAHADLLRHFGVTPPSVNQMLITLERQGLIQTPPRRRPQHRTADRSQYSATATPQPRPTGQNRCAEALVAARARLWQLRRPCMGEFWPGGDTHGGTIAGCPAAPSIGTSGEG